MDVVISRWVQCPEFEAITGHPIGNLTLGRFIAGSMLALDWSPPSPALAGAWICPCHDSSDSFPSQERCRFGHSFILSAFPSELVMRLKWWASASHCWLMVHRKPGGAVPSEWPQNADIGALPDAVGSLHWLPSQSCFACETSSRLQFHTAESSSSPKNTLRPWISNPDKSYKSVWLVATYTLVSIMYQHCLYDTILLAPSVTARPQANSSPSPSTCPPQTSSPTPVPRLFFSSLNSCSQWIGLMHSKSKSALGKFGCQQLWIY